MDITILFSIFTCLLLTVALFFTRNGGGKTACLHQCIGMSSIMDLPPEIVADILSRISIKTIAHASCVCKLWHTILSDDYFVNLHLLRSPAWLIIHQQSDQGKDDVLINVDELDQRSDQHDIHLHVVTRFAVGLDLEHIMYSLEGSVNGLICIWQFFEIYICNPITRENIILPKHKYNMPEYDALRTLGFGLVKGTNQYKVVFFYQCKWWFHPPEGLNKAGCLVHTLGTGIWRNLAHVPFLPNDYWRGIFLDGKLHWLAHYAEDSTANNEIEIVCAFDLEKESFQQIASAPQVDRNVHYRRLGLLRGCLCVCDSTKDSELVIWVMNDYGRKESWIKEIVIQNIPDELGYEMVHPLKVLRDGTILMECHGRFLFTYHPVQKTLQIYDDNGATLGYDAMVYSPSFIRLKNYKLADKVSVS